MTRPISPRHVLRFAISVLVVVGVFLFATRADASEHQPDYSPVTYLTQDWEERAAVSLTPSMLAEWWAIHELLPNWIPAPPEPAYAVARTYPPEVERWRGLIESHFQPHDVPWAMRVMACESQGDPYAKNPTSTASGLFQFLRGWWSGSNNSDLPAFDPFDPELNVRAAAWLFYHPEGGPSHWVCR